MEMGKKAMAPKENTTRWAIATIWETNALEESFVGGIWRGKLHFSNALSLSAPKMFLATGPIQVTTLKP